MGILLNITLSLSYYCLWFKEPLQSLLKFAVLILLNTFKHLKICWNLYFFFLILIPFYELEGSAFVEFPEFAFKIEFNLNSPSSSCSLYLFL